MTTRTKRFSVAEDETIPPYRPVPDDYRFLQHALRRRLITTKQLCLLNPERSSQKIVRRVRTLMKNGLVDKPRGQVGIFVPGGGSRPHAFAISDAGAKAVAKHFQLELVGTNRSRDNRDLKPAAIEEILDTSQFMTLLELSAAKHPDVVMRDSFDLLLAAQEKQRRKSKPRSFTTRVTWNGTASIRGIEPDEIVQLHYPRREPGKDTASFMVEIDRGTETVEPREAILTSERFFRQSYVLLKWVIYASAFRAKQPLPFGFRAFRVLMITTTPARMALMQRVERKWLSAEPFRLPPGFVLFSNQERIAEHAEDVLSMPWEDGDGREWHLDGKSKQTSTHISKPNSEMAEQIDQ